MHQYISHFGFCFIVFEIHGLLKYTITRRGKVPKVHEICESDIEDGSYSDSNTTERMEQAETGIDASAVRIQLRLIKNDGVLQFAFEGNDGSNAQWTFDGIGLSDGGRMVATAATQTHIGPKECPMCGKDKDKSVEVKHEETQTNAILTQSTAVQTLRATMAATSVQTTGQQTPLHHQSIQSTETIDRLADIPVATSPMQTGQHISATNMPRSTAISETSTKDEKQTQGKSRLKLNVKSVLRRSKSTGTQTESGRDLGMSLIHCQDITTTNPDLKRKAPVLSEGTKPFNKRAKSTHDSKPWPRHLYMKCNRKKPNFKGGDGVLHIDVHEGEVWFEGWYGRQGMRVYERKQVDLHDETSKKLFRNACSTLTGDSKSSLRRSS
jgi:hypothetical protein